MFPYVLVIVPYIYIVTLVNPLYFLFLWFLWYIALDFVHLSILWSSNIVYIALYIALYCIYAFWVVITHEIYIRSTDTTAGGARAWGRSWQKRPVRPF